MQELYVYGATKLQLNVYYFLSFISFLYLLYKFRKSKIIWYIILLFYSGLFGFIGKDVQNIYRIVITALAAYGIIKYNLFKNSKPWVNISFFLFSITFIISSFLNDDYFNIIFSQYSRYFILFAVYLFISRNREKEFFRYILTKVLFELLLVQIILSVFKFFIMGLTESVVGSVSSQGGAMATALPILGFMFLWIKRNGQLNRRDWIFIVGLMFIGFVSLKRAIWFVIPFIIALFMIYVPGRKISPRLILLAIIAVPLVFYLGVRLNPSLNREKRIGGSFDLNYALNYAERYNYGENSSDKTSGRGNAAIYIVDKITSNTITEKEWFGYGLRFMYAADYQEYADMGLSITSKGSATGVYQTMVSNGFLGIIFTLFFALSMLLQTKNRRIRIVLIGFFLWEYIFYTGIVLREPSLSFLLVYLILFSPLKVVNANETIGIKGK